MLGPLKQWICDRCGKVIQAPEHGWLEWLTDEDRKRFGFKIVHSIAYSPIAGGKRNVPSCYHYDGHVGRGDGHLDHYLGPEGLVHLLAWLDVGPYHSPRIMDPDVDRISEWAELCRRLFVPYYEEARQYWGRALDDGYFEGANEVWVYLPDTLKTLIERYSDSIEEGS